MTNEIDTQAVTMALAEEFAARGVEASYEYGEVVLISFGADVPYLVIGTANAPRWGWTLYATDGDNLDGTDVDALETDPAHIAADAITASVWRHAKIDLRSV